MTKDASKESSPADLDDAKSEAIHAADEIRDAAARKAEELKDVASGQIEDSKERLDELRREGERYIRENPAKSVLIALGLGYIIGRIIK